MTIYKYPIMTTDKQSIQMPLGAKILCIQTQNELPCLWALVDDLPLEPRCILIFHTGHPVPADKSLYYIGTYQLLGGQLVFHVFEDRTPLQLAKNDLSNARDNLRRARIVASNCDPSKPWKESGQTLNEIITGYEQWEQEALEAVKQAESL